MESGCRYKSRESGVHAPPFEIWVHLRTHRVLGCEIARLRFVVEFWELFYYFLTTLQFSFYFL